MPLFCIFIERLEKPKDIYVYMKKRHVHIREALALLISVAPNQCSSEAKFNFVSICSNERFYGPTLMLIYKNMIQFAHTSF